MFLFFAVLFNYVYGTFLHDFTLTLTTRAIQVIDAAGFEAHFVRFIHMTLFQQDGIADKNNVHSLVQIFDLVSIDAALLMFVITPLFLAAMHFYTAPFKRRYTNKLQIFVVPLAFLPYFFFTNIDICILSTLVLIQNGYICWY